MQERQLVLGNRTFHCRKVGIMKVHSLAAEQMSYSRGRQSRKWAEGYLGSEPTEQDIQTCRDLLAKDFDSKPTTHQVSEWLFSADGLPFVFWLSARDAHPDLTLEAATEIIHSLDSDELEEAYRAAHIAQGTQPGNPTKPATEPETSSTTLTGTS